MLSLEVRLFSSTGDERMRMLGEMLKRVPMFLSTDNTPLIYVVLPKACIFNSRYMNEELWLELTASCGFGKLISSHTSLKLAYYLWQWEGKQPEKGREYAKKVIKTGADRNNFAVIISTNSKK